jgi:hypothetical protein
MYRWRIELVAEKETQFGSGERNRRFEQERVIDSKELIVFDELLETEGEAVWEWEIASHKLHAKYGPKYKDSGEHGFEEEHTEQDEGENRDEEQSGAAEVRENKQDF